MYQLDILIKYGSINIYLIFVTFDESDVISMLHSYADIYLELINARKR